MEKVDNPFTATFTMKQHGLTGGIELDLQFDPKIDADAEVTPAIYEYMSRMVLQFISVMEQLNAGIVTDEDEIHNVMNLDLSVDKTLN